LTVPNAISVIRLLGVPLFLWLILVRQDDVWAIVVLVVSGASDYLDGYLARRLNQTSRFGQLLDPVADRLYILSTVIGLAARHVIPLWFAVLLPLRDVLLWGLAPALRKRGYGPMPVHFLGKAATAALLYAFPLLLLANVTTLPGKIAEVFGWAFALWGVVLYWWVGVVYALQVRALVRLHDRGVLNASEY
jgi:cardiolipin synthase